MYYANNRNIEIQQLQNLIVILRKEINEKIRIIDCQNRKLRKLQNEKEEILDYFFNNKYAKTTPTAK